jgi:hypothetical protein
MEILASAQRRMMLVSNVVELAAIALVLVGTFGEWRWAFAAAGTGSVLLGADLVYTRRLVMLGCSAAAKARVARITWHRWVAGLALIGGGGWILVTGVLRL